MSLISPAMTTVLLMMWIKIRLLKYCTCWHVTDMQKKRNRNNFKEVHNLEPGLHIFPHISMLDKVLTLLWRDFEEQRGPSPPLRAPHIRSYTFRSWSFLSYLPTMVGQRTLWTGGRFCPLTARGLKIAPQGENSAGRPHPDRWTRGHKYR